MTGRRPTRRRNRAAAPRVGLFGILGAGNIGNDAQMESILGYLRSDHPDAIVDAMCPGPERLREVYGIAAIPLYRQHASGRSEWQGRARQGTAWQGKAWQGKAWQSITAVPLKALGIGMNTVRMVRWVHRHDVVIVPGAGVLEASLPVRPWETPYSMFVLCASGRLLGTKVALISVGADAINQRLTRWLSTSAARLAFYRSYRDNLSRDAMRQRGLDVSGDHICPDLAFGIQALPSQEGDPQTVGVGVLAYYGGNDDRREAAELHASYLQKMKFFVRWLLDNGRNVRLFVGETNGSDDSVVREIMADMRAQRPGLDPARVIAEPVLSFGDLMQAMSPVSNAVVTRYHNMICALELAKPTISIGYSPKNAALMTEMGLPEFCQDIESLDVELLIKQFTEMEERSPQLKDSIRECCAAKAQRLDEEFATVSSLLFPTVAPGRPAASG